jgi:hypothetical protein
MRLGGVSLGGPLEVVPSNSSKCGTVELCVFLVKSDDMARGEVILRSIIFSLVLGAQ